MATADTNLVKKYQDADKEKEKDIMTLPVVLVGERRAYTAPEEIKDKKLRALLEIVEADPKRNFLDAILLLMEMGHSPISSPVTKELRRIMREKFNLQPLEAKIEEKLKTEPSVSSVMSTVISTLFSGDLP